MKSAIMLIFLLLVLFGIFFEADIPPIYFNMEEINRRDYTRKGSKGSDLTYVYEGSGGNSKVFNAYVMAYDGTHRDENFIIIASSAGRETVESCAFMVEAKQGIPTFKEVPPYEKCKVNYINKIAVGRYQINGMSLQDWFMTINIIDKEEVGFIGMLND